VAAVAEPLPEPEPAAPPKPATAAEKLRAEPPAKPQIDAEGVPVAWMLQVASVSSPAKADDLRDRLLAMGHKAYSKKIRRGERNLWRVYIGPKFEKAKLESIRSAVDAELGVQTMVMRYYP
jgi:DedD protein